MPPKNNPKGRANGRKLCGNTLKTTGINDLAPRAPNEQTIELPGPCENSLYRLANEIIAMIFQQLGEPPRSVPYVIQDLQDVHPCYAICSTSKFLRQWYTMIMGQPSNEIELTLLPADYVFEEEDLENEIKKRLCLLGHEGLKRVTVCHIFGSRIDSETGNAAIDRWLRGSRIPKRLEPEDKVLVKNHVEQDIVQKIVLINNLFECIYNLFKGLKEIKVTPGELPYNVWSTAIRQYIRKEHQSLQKFGFFPPHPARAWKHSYDYLEQLTKPTYFLSRKEQPSNYPEHYYEYRTGLEGLERVVTNYIKARDAVDNYSGKLPDL